MLVPPEMMSPRQLLMEQPPAFRAAWLMQQPAEVLADIERGAWWWEARPKQIPPPGRWTVCLFLTGRGWGKNRAGSEWLIEEILRIPFDLAGNPTQWLILDSKLEDARVFCIEGPSGVLNVMKRRGLIEGVDYLYKKAPKPEITFLRDGRPCQVIYVEGASDIDTGRGFNLAGCLFNEMGKWRYSYEIWKQAVLPGLRAPLPNGDKPRCVVMTTPKPLALLREWVQRFRAGHSFVQVVQGSIFENIDNLSAEMVAELAREYEGTTLGLQELLGQLLDEAEGALWKLKTLEDHRIKPSEVPELTARYVGMDPAGTGTGDECGLIGTGRGLNMHYYVLEDWSKRISGKASCRRAWELVAHLNADWLVYEDNFGKAYLTEMLQDEYRAMQKEGIFPAHGFPPMRPVHAQDGKRLRAQPVAMRYEQGRYHHVGYFPQLEEQQVMWVPEDSPDSPDRIDALVHAGAFARKRERGVAKVASATATPATPGTPARAGARMSTSGLSPLG